MKQGAAILSSLSVESFCRQAALKCLALDPERLEAGLEEIFEAFCDFSSFDQVLVAHFPDATDERQETSLSHYWPRTDVNGLRAQLRQHFSSQRTWLAEEIRKGEPVFISRLADASADAEAYRTILQDCSVNSSFAVPLAFGCDTIGFLLAASKDERAPATGEERLLFSHMADLIALVAGRRRRLTHSRFQALEQVVGDTGATFRDVVESLPDGVIACDAEGYVTYTNPAAEEMTGCTWEEMHGNRVYEVFFRKDGPEFEEQREKHHKRYQDRLKGVSEEYEALVTRRDGTQRWFHTKASPIRDVHGKCVGSIGVNADVTERKLLEAQLLWSQKMDAVGRLAGSVAHDFNNLLTVIGGYANLVLKKLSKDDSNHPRVAAICEATETACSLTQQLLALSQRQVVQPTVVSVNDLLRQNAGVLRGLVGENCSFIFDLDEALPAISADIGQLQQIFINLVVNAGEAMEQGGTIRVATSVENIAEKQTVDGRRIPAGRYVQFEVSDAGVGIRREDMERLFEPFYSTKRDGTGLGLSTVYGIVTQHGGDISVDSTAGQGSTFRILWPSVNEQPMPLAPPVQQSELRGVETILLAEDEEAARDLIHEVLEAHGYTVVAVENGREALEALQDQDLVKRLDLVLTDVVMPHVNGFELAEFVAKQFPHLKLLMISGCTQDSTIPDNIVKKGFPFLAKPFHPEALLEKVRSVLRTAGVPQQHVT